MGGKVKSRGVDGQWAIKKVYLFFCLCLGFSSLYSWQCASSCRLIDSPAPFLPIMSSKHLFPSAEGLVVKYLNGLVSWNPALALIPSDKVVFNTKHSPKKVSIISGGGAGHEPAWCGYVGNNMLAAAASGDIFASPSARQIESAIKSVPSDEGTILVITNYTGDCLHFGLASAKANAEGYQKGKVVVMNCGDDVSVGKGGNGLVGRRGLAGQILGKLE